MRLKNKIALVTGAATGIGAAVAKHFASEGAVTYATYHTKGKGRHQSSQENGILEYVKMDVRDESSWLEVRKMIEARHGRLDVLVNNAGVVLDVDNVAATTLEQWNNTMAVNATGAFLGCHTMLELLKKSEAASIVNVVSSIVFKPDVLVAYASSKAAMWGLTRSIALYCSREKLPIRCNSVHPGGVETEMLRDFIEAAPDPAAVREFAVQNQLIKRFAEPIEIARFIAYLASDEASFVTGAAFPIDGGLSIN